MQGRVVIITATLIATCFMGSNAEQSNKCECAAFNVPDPSVPIPDGTEPLLAQNPMNVTCNEEGGRNCELMCIELAKLGKEKADEFICVNIKHALAFRPSLWSKTCDGAWKYSGLTCEREFCCHEGKSVPCEKQ